MLGRQPGDTTYFEQLVLKLQSATAWELTCISPSVAQIELDNVMLVEFRETIEEAMRIDDYGEPHELSIKTAKRGDMKYLRNLLDIHCTDQYDLA
jgi:hypothetical protein